MMTKNVLLTDIVAFLGKEILAVYGNPDSIEIHYVKDPLNVNEFTLDWISSRRPEKQQIAESTKARSIFVNEEVVYSTILKAQNKVLIVVQNPQLTLAKIISQFFIVKPLPKIHPTAIIDKNAVIGKNAAIGPNVVIGNCIIGENVSIYGNTYIYDHVIIKDNVEIHNGVSIGNEAHNFIKDNDGNLIKFPHIGKVIIENDVVIGANSVISRGVLEDTIIKRGCKIAQLVFIGANNSIGENCAIRPNVMTSGSVKIGKNSIIAPTVTIREHCSIGDGSMIGMGAVVTKNVPAGETWVGNPAKKIGK